MTHDMKRRVINRLHVLSNLSGNIGVHTLSTPCVMSLLRGSEGVPCVRPLLAAARVAAPFLCAASAAASASLVVVALFPVGLPFRRADLLLGAALATARPAGGCTAGLVGLGWARTLVGLEGWRLGVVSLSASLKTVDACTSALPSHCRCSTIAAHPIAVAWLRQG